MCLLSALRLDVLLGVVGDAASNRTDSSPLGRSRLTCRVAIAAEVDLGARRRWLVRYAFAHDIVDCDEVSVDSLVDLLGLLLSGLHLMLMLLES